MSNFLADKSYIAVKPQAAATTPIIPTTQIPLVSCDIKVDPKFSDDRRMKGLDWKTDDQLRGSRSVSGNMVRENGSTAPIDVNQGHYMQALNLIREIDRKSVV
jgi:hypothetical protein